VALCYVSLVYAFDSSSWTLRALLKWRTGPILQHLTTRTIPTGWTSVGCVTDGAARALSYFYTSTSLTQDSCVTTCDSKGTEEIPCHLLRFFKNSGAKGILTLVSSMLTSVGAAIPWPIVLG
jgi:hypothetical protein